MRRRSFAATALCLVAALVPARAAAEDGPAYFQGTFADPRWGGAVGLVLSEDGRTVMSVAGIAPGPCDDKDFGRLLPGRDGATGPRFAIFTPARIAANGRFTASERRAGQRRPFKPAYTVAVKGRVTGGVVRGTLRATVETPFDRCTANAAFSARRTAG